MTDHGHRRLLRPRRERPYSRRAAEKRDELASSHVGHGRAPPALCQQGHGCTVGSPPSTVSRSGRQVLGQHLKCSESRREVASRS